MLYVKFFLAVILSAIPFFYRFYIHPRRDIQTKWGSLFSFIGTLFPWIRKTAFSIAYFVREIYERMRKSDNARKFFIRITLLLMLVYEYVDLCAAQSALQIVKDNESISGKINAGFDVETWMTDLSITSPVALGMAYLITFMFFFYGIANSILTRIHGNRLIFYGMSCLIVVIPFCMENFFILSKILYIILLAAFVYPQKSGSEPQGGRKNIPWFRKKTQRFSTIKSAA